MGQKVNPIGLRLGITRKSYSNWYSDDNVAGCVREDSLIRDYLKKRLEKAGISSIYIARKAQKVLVELNASRPGIVIGKKGEEVEKVKNELKYLTKKDVEVSVKEIKKPEIDAQLVANNIATQIEGRVAYKRAVKKALSTAMRMDAEGIKIKVGGRLNGAEIARQEEFKEGRTPLHTLRADIDYATATAHTTYGCIGIKVWICKGEKLSLKDERASLDDKK
ncbi:MAG: 30S ribosomal protein S3 [Chitinispirillales bacterium]|nr:30S ribosomal protein S3 [Chitinispirillales bacterium]